MADFNIRKGDTNPIVEATLKDGNGDAIDLSGASAVRFHMRLTGTTGTPKVNGACVVADAVNGAVTYSWVTADTNTAGVYDAEFQVTFTNSAILTVPNNRNLSIVVLEEIN